MINGLITLGRVDVDSYNHQDNLQNLKDVLTLQTPEHEIEELYSTALSRCIIYIILSLISLVTSSLLIYGIHQAKYKYNVPTLVWNPINVGIEIVEIIVI